MLMTIPSETEDLILARLSGELSPEGQKKLEEWIEASEANRKIYTEYCTLWYGGQIGKRKKEEGHRSWELICREHRKRRQRIMVRRVIAVAACCMLFIGGYWLYMGVKSVGGPEPITVAELLQHRETEKVKLVLSTGREILLDGSITEQEKGAYLYSDSVGLKYSASGQAGTEEMVYNELIVPKCGEYRLVLTDGTRIMVNSESVVRYPVHFSGDKREVWVSGEAYFDVVRNEKQPFIVHLDHATVKVLGTSFNVMAYREEANTEITLVQGKVEVGTAGQQEILLPGYQIQVDNTTSRMENRKVDVTQYISWKEGILRFDDMPLGQLMNRLSRWYDITFEFRQEELKDRLFSGGLKKYEQLERILEMIQEINDVRFSVSDRKILIDKK